MPQIKVQAKGHAGQDIVPGLQADVFAATGKFPAAEPLFNGDGEFQGVNINLPVGIAQSALMVATQAVDNNNGVAIATLFPLQEFQLYEGLADQAAVASHQESGFALAMNSLTGGAAWKATKVADEIISGAVSLRLEDTDDNLPNPSGANFSGGCSGEILVNKSNVGAWTCSFKMKRNLKLNTVTRAEGNVFSEFFFLLQDLTINPFQIIHNSNNANWQVRKPTGALVTSSVAKTAVVDVTMGRDANGLYSVQLNADAPITHDNGFLVKTNFMQLFFNTFEINSTATLASKPIIIDDLKIDLLS